MKRAARIAALALASLAASDAAAARRFLTAGEGGAPFLRVPVSARAAALGEAFAGFGDDAASMEYNPAGIGALPGGHVAVSQAAYLDDVTLSALAAAGSWRGTGFGIYYRRLAADDTARDAAGTETGGLSHEDSVAGFCAARRFGGRFIVGAGAKSVARRIERDGAGAFEVESGAAAFDAGFLMRFPTGATLGLAVQNAGSGASFEYSGPAGAGPFGASSRGAKEALPLVVRVGGAHPVGRMSFSWEASQPRDGRTVAAAGAEYNAASFFALRGGFKYQRFVDVTLGLGFWKGPFGLDYAFSPRADIGNAHRATLGVRF